MSLSITPAGSTTLGTGVGTFLATPTFSNLNTALTGDDAAGLAASNVFTGSNINSFSGTASTPAIKYSGVPFAGTGTTSFPLVYINDSNATASTTLNTSGTYLGVNIDGTQDGIKVMKDGVSKFYVASTGETGLVALQFLNSSATPVSYMSSPSDGVIRMSDSGISSFNRLQFGGTTSSFPALKRSTTSIQGRLADDSAFCPVQGKITTDTNATTGLTAGVLAALTNASIVLYDASGQAYRIPCII